MVRLSAGVMMKGAFIHLIPEAIDMMQGLYVFLLVLVGFFLFFIIKRFFIGIIAIKNTAMCIPSLI